jgi:diadenylate cyclase
MPRSDGGLARALALVAEGTPLSEAIDGILTGGTGALIVIGDEDTLSLVCDGGFALAAPLTPQRLVELAKMDGAIIVDPSLGTIARANVHLVPDSGTPTAETGIRHRSAERVSRQTGVPVIAISRRQRVARLYVDGAATILRHSQEAR